MDLEGCLADGVCGCMGPPGTDEPDGAIIKSAQALCAVHMLMLPACRLLGTDVFQEHDLVVMGWGVSPMPGPGSASLVLKFHATS